MHDFNDPCDDVSRNVIGWALNETHDLVRESDASRSLRKAVKYGVAYAGYPTRVLASAMRVCREEAFGSNP